MTEAGLRDVQVSPHFVYADASRPRWVDGFTRKTFIAMVEGARAPSLRLGLIREDEWDAGIAELQRTATDDGTFCYTFFKANAQTAPPCRPDSGPHDRHPRDLVARAGTG